MVRPSGTVTFLFTDIEGSTRRWEVDPDVMRTDLAVHDAVLRAAVEANDGWLFKHTGDGICAAFSTAGDAVAAAVHGQRQLELPVRMGIATGSAESRGEDYFGPALNRAARVMAAGHGGQILVAASTAALLDGVDLVDLGEHGLRDLSGAYRLFQVRAERIGEVFPALRTVDAVPGNLPSQSTSFVGRDIEVAELIELVRSHRLVTLTGPGGMGKTRLALQVAAELTGEYPGGAWLCELAGVADPAAVDHVVLATLGFVVRSGATPRTALVEALAPRELLLVLDNCEHLRTVVGELVEAVLHAASRVSVLATSREALVVRGEHRWTLDSLPVDSAAVDLFVERAAAVRRGFIVSPENRPVISEICGHLDGLPLAIELAAARTRSLTLEDLRDRLDERLRILSMGRLNEASGRHDTLRATLDWSYELLLPDERALFDCLSIFAGSFDLTSAASVSDADRDELDVLDVLTALVDKSMAQQFDTRGVTRYRMLETMRHYGAEHIGAANGVDELSQHHAVYYASFVERAAEGLRSVDEAAWVKSFDDEFDNLRIAVRWALDQGQTDLALRLISPQWTYSLDQLVAEPGEWAEEALRLPEAQHHPLAALTHIVAGWGAAAASRYDDLLSHGQAAVTLAEAAAPQHLWLALNVAWAGAFALGRHDIRQLCAERIVDTARAANDDYAISRAIWVPVLGHRSEPVDINVRAAVAECFELAQRVGNPTLLARAHILTGIVRCPDDPMDASEHFAAGEQLARLVNARMLTAYGIAFGSVAASLLNPELGLRELLRMLDWHQTTATPMGATRITLRDILPALTDIGLNRLIIILDAHLPTVAVIQPERDSAAVQQASHLLGSVATTQALEQAHAMDFAEVLDLLHEELETVIRYRTAQSNDSR